MRDKAIVIGTGVAGLAVAIRLAIRGFEVHAYEKNKYPGGKLHAFSQNGYHFDAGPSLFTQPQHLHEIFELAGEPMADYLTYSNEEISCKYFFEDGIIVDAYAERGKLKKELRAKLGEDELKVDNYLDHAERSYNNIGRIFLENSLHKKKTWFQKGILPALNSVKLALLTSTIHRHNEKSFSHPHTVQIFDRYATYNGSNPYKAPAMLSMIAHLEHNEGAYYLNGGMINITNALVNLATKKGVQFHYESEVQSVIQNAGKAVGVVVDNKNIAADVVVSDADVYEVYTHLLNDNEKGKKVLRQERSSSAYIFYWGIKKSFAQLGLHNIFFSSDYKKEFANIFDNKAIYNDPTIYLNITSKKDANHAPVNCENWFVMVNVPASNTINWEEKREVMKNNVLNKLSRILGEDVAQFIETEEILNPEKIESQTGSYLGALYGTSSNTATAAFLRHPNFSKKIKNLFFVGGSVHPGGGIPLCLQGAKIADALVNQRRKTHKA